MLIEQARLRVEAMRARLKSRWATWLPFRCKYIDAFASFLLLNLQQVKLALEGAQQSGDLHRFVDFLVTYAAGNVPLPFYVQPFAPLFQQGLRIWLHANIDLWAATIGDTPEK